MVLICQRIEQFFPIGAFLLLVLWLVVQDVLDIEAAILGERPPYLIRLQHLHIDVELCRLCRYLCPLGFGKLYGCLFRLAQAP